ncbi:pfkB-like carbohydrate kinase family protein [Artemisia annua]|uniref:PfkB-like carbohydrate kinase family protein n=1 Tax=Artemisia annua TaxID=35608 RepID=A0A2U1L176_ARTAN|nr:pfkB-like carbohydrate kinase family protein [Artemisia annua]
MPPSGPELALATDTLPAREADMKEPLESLLINEKENGEAVIIGGMVLDIHATPSVNPAPRTTTPGKVHYAAGGVARNIAECVSKLGTKPFMISALGSDMSGEQFDSGVGPHGLNTMDGICYWSTGSLQDYQLKERYLTPQWIQQFKSNIASAPIVMVDANLSQPALEASCQLAAEVGTPVWFEPVSVAKSRRIVSVAKYVTFASPNEDELIAMANALSDKDIFFPIQKDGIPVTSLFQQLKPAIWVLLEKGIKVVILTLGSKGVLLCSKHHLNFQNIVPNRTSKSHNISQKLHEIINQVCPSDRFFSGLKESSRSSPFVVHFPAVLSSSVVRLTGAGDCLVGGSIASFCVGLDLMQSIAVGIAAAKATVEERYLTPQWIQQFKSNIASAPIVMVDANLSQPALEASCQLAAEVGTPVWFEPVSVAKSRRIVSVAKYVTFASPNEDELIAMANALSDKDIFSPIQKDGIPVTSLFQQLKPAIWVLLEKGIKVVILTLGSKGVLLCSKHHLNFQNIGPNRTIKSHNISQKLHEIINQVCPSDRFFSGLKESSRSSPFVVHFPAVLSSSVVRLTGAGDCLVGGSIASFCVGLDLMQSIAVGIAAAKATVEVEANVPTEYSLEQITADASTVYLGATVVFSRSML